MESKDQTDAVEEHKSYASSTSATLECDEVTSRAIAEGHKTKGDEEFRKQEYSNAIDSYTKGLQVRCKDDQFNAKLYSDRATSHFLLGNCYQALSDVKSTRDLQPSNLQGIIIGVRAYKELNQFEEAIKWCDEGFKIDSGQNILVELKKSIQEELESLKSDRGTETETTMDKGSEEPIASPVEFVPLNLNITKQAGDRKREGEYFLKLGENYFKTGNFQKAIQNFEQYARICKELEDRTGELCAYGKLGDTYSSVGKVDEAVISFEMQLRIAEDVGVKRSDVRALSNLTSLWYGEYGCEGLRRADDYHQEHLKCAIESGDKVGEGHAYGNLGMLRTILGDFCKAKKYHELNLTIVKELGDRVGEGKVCGNLGRVHRRLHNFDKAIEYHKMQLQIAKDENSEIDQACAYYHIGCNLESVESLEEALEFYKSSTRLCKTIRASLRSRKDNSFTDEWKINLFDEFSHVHIALCRTLLKLDFVLEALWAAEQGRAQALADVIRSRYGIQACPLKQEETVSDVYKYISTNTVFFAIDNNTINIWLLMPDQDVRFEKATFPADGKENIREMLRNPRLDHHRALFDVTLGPIANQLEGDELVIIPCGELWLAPWSSAAFHPDLDYLNESLRIRVAPSLTTLKLITDCPQGYRRKSGALLVGDPSFPDNEVSYCGRVRPNIHLPYARKEVKMIGKLVNTEPLTGENATKMAVLNRLRNVALLHIAAHSDVVSGEIFLAPNPTRSSVVPEEKDFVLTVEDVLNVQTKLQLVVLSCSYSGRGNISSDGLIYLARAFLAAGARSVLVSLWSLDEGATFEFMKHFYKHLVKGRSASKALNKAMKSLRETDIFGFWKYWAPFVLLGDDVTLEFLQEPRMR